jgi:transcriptional regulator with XRE-family HTH domain
MDETRYVPQALRIFMWLRGLEPKDIEERAGMSQGQVSDYLGKPTNMKLNTLRRLMEALDITFRDLGLCIEFLRRLEKQPSLPLDIAESPQVAEGPVAPPAIFRIAAEAEWLHRETQRLLRETTYQVRPRSYYV